MNFIICIAYNKDVGLFDHLFRALTYLKYQYVIFCNDAKYGGPAFYESQFNFLSCTYPIFGELLSHVKKTQYQIGFELGGKRLDNIKSMSSSPLDRYLVRLDIMCLCGMSDMK